MGCCYENLFKCSWSHGRRWLQGPYMVKTFKNLLWNQEADDLETLYTALKYYQICSNDDTGLTLTIFMTWSIKFVS